MHTPLATHVHSFGCMHGAPGPHPLSAGWFLRHILSSSCPQVRLSERSFFLSHSCSFVYGESPRFLQTAQAWAQQA
jgi:hypothetical protein